MSGTFVFRQAGPGDAPQIDQLTQRAYQKWVARIGRKPLPMTVDYAQAVIDHRIDLLSDETGAVVGLIEVHRQSHHLVIENVAVDPSAQGRGHGRALVAHAEGIARDLGLGEIKLYTNKLFAENVAFYEALGYGHEREEAFKGGFIVHMRKQLT
jgi:ribosomal protein S18 acetylase RimI-like enzyme